MISSASLLLRQTPRFVGEDRGVPLIDEDTSLTPETLCSLMHHSKQTQVDKRSTK